MQDGNVETTKPKRHGISVAFLLTLIGMILLAGAFIYYYVAASAQVSRASTRILALQDQLDELDSIVQLSKSSVKANQITVNQAAIQSTLVVSFVADYAGYVVVSGTSTTTNGSIRVTDSFSDYPHNDTWYSFGTGTTRMIPVLPGTISVYFGNSNLFGGATATLTVVYYY